MEWSYMEQFMSCVAVFPFETGRCVSIWNYLLICLEQWMPTFYYKQYSLNQTNKIEMIWRRDKTVTGFSKKKKKKKKCIYIYII